MRKTLIFFLTLLVAASATSYSQNLMDYVKEVKGDVLVIKDYSDMEGQPNSLNNAIAADNENVPAGRVYELRTAGWYPQSSSFTTPSDRPVVIAGEYNGSLVAIDDASKLPPLISGYTDEGGSSTGGINWGDDLTVKNTNIVIGAPDGSGGWAFFGSSASNKKITFENNIMEHNWWVFVQSNSNEGNSFYFKDNYFVNMSGRACRRNGGVYDNVDNNTDTMYVENNTHVMAQGYIYKFRNYPVNFIYFNHNTFVNIGSVVFETQGYQSNSIITNNMFINCNVQPFRPNMTEDIPEQAGDGLPQGLIDVAKLPETMEQVPRKWLVQSNLAYWDSRVQDLATEANNSAVNGFTTWVNQTMLMNDRTQSLFDDDANFPYLTETGWINKLPNFADTKDLLSAQVDSLKAFCLATIDTTSPDVLGTWRVVNTGGTDDFIYSDFPIPIDLSYDDADLLTAGTDGLPLGDLNWFPTQKADFVSNQATYFGDLVTALESGNPVTDVQEIAGLPVDFELSQNYPNPFNPTTSINYSIPKAGNVTLKVYNAVGQEVATLVNGYQNAQNYKVNFDASQLSSGVYFYSLTSGDFVQTKKMMLLK